MSLAAVDLLTPVVPLVGALGCGLDALTVDAAGRGGGLAALPLSLLPVERHHHLLPDPLLALVVEVPIDRLPAAKLLGQHPPLTAGLGHVEKAVDDGAPLTGWSSPTPRAPFARRPQRRKDRPLCVGQVRRILNRRTHGAPFDSGVVGKPESGPVSTLLSSPFGHPTDF